MTGNITPQLRCFPYSYLRNYRVLKKGEGNNGHEHKRLYIDRGFCDDANFLWLNKLPSRNLAAIKVHFYFSFIAYPIVNIFKRALTGKYRNAGVEVLRLDILRKNAVICFNGKSLKFEFNRKYELRYNEQSAGINEFISRARDTSEFVKTLA